MRQFYQLNGYYEIIMYYTTKASFTLQNSFDTYLYINKKCKGQRDKQKERDEMHFTHVKWYNNIRE
jgi:hypothetical protein